MMSQPQQRPPAMVPAQPVYAQPPPPPQVMVVQQQPPPVQRVQVVMSTPSVFADPFITFRPYRHRHHWWGGGWHHHHHHHSWW